MTHSLDRLVFFGQNVVELGFVEVPDIGVVVELSHVQVPFSGVLHVEPRRERGIIDFIS